MFYVLFVPHVFHVLFVLYVPYVIYVLFVLYVLNVLFVPYVPHVFYMFYVPYVPIHIYVFLWYMCSMCFLCYMCLMWCMSLGLWIFVLSYVLSHKIWENTSNSFQIFLKIIHFNQTKQRHSSLLWENCAAFLLTNERLRYIWFEEMFQYYSLVKKPVVQCKIAKHWRLFLFRNNIGHGLVEMD